MVNAIVLYFNSDSCDGFVWVHEPTGINDHRIAIIHQKLSFPSVYGIQVFECEHVCMEAFSGKANIQSIN